MALNRKVLRLRARAFVRQGFRCFYCGLPMWNSHVGDFTRVYGVTLDQAKTQQCTAEHLLARGNGGQDTEDNVVAACRHCNEVRHRYMPNAPWQQFFAVVGIQMANGVWRRRSLLQRLMPKPGPLLAWRAERSNALELSP
jgi:hypothetical protein